MSSREKLLEVVVGAKDKADPDQEAGEAKKKTKPPAWEAAVLSYFCEKISKKSSVSYLCLPRLPNIHAILEKIMMILRKNCNFYSKGQFEDIFTLLAKIATHERRIAEGCYYPDKVFRSIQEIMAQMLADSLSKKFPFFDDISLIHESLKEKIGIVWEAPLVTSLLKNAAYSSLMKLTWENAIQFFKVK